MQPDIRKSQLPIRDLIAAPYQRPQSGQQFRRQKRLGQIVISSEIQPGYLIAQFTFGCQHQDRRADALLACCRRNIEPVFSRQHHIQNRQVINSRFESQQPLQSIGKMIYVILLLMQDFAQSLCQAYLVFYQQQTHGQPLRSFLILQQKIEEGLNFCRILIVISNGELFQLLLRVFKRKIGEKVSDSDAQTMAVFLNRRNALSI